MLFPYLLSCDFAIMFHSFLQGVQSSEYLSTTLYFYCCHNEKLYLLGEVTFFAFWQIHGNLIFYLQIFAK